MNALEGVRLWAGNESAARVLAASGNSTGELQYYQRAAILPAIRGPLQDFAQDDSPPQVLLIEEEPCHGERFSFLLS